jgi:NTE family protein
MQAAIITEKLRYRRPDLLVQPDIRDVRVLEFHRFQEIFDQARPAQEALREGLDQPSLGRP